MIQMAISVNIPFCKCVQAEYANGQISKICISLHMHMRAYIYANRRKKDG